MIPSPWPTHQILIDAQALILVNAQFELAFRALILLFLLSYFLKLQYAFG